MFINVAFSSVIKVDWIALSSLEKCTTTDEKNFEQLLVKLFFADDSLEVCIPWAHELDSLVPLNVGLD